MTTSQIIKTPKIFVTLRQAISLRFRSSAKFHSVPAPKLYREKIPLKKTIQLIKTSTLSQSNLLSIRFAFLLIDLNAYNSSVNNCPSLPTLLSVPQHTDFISIYSLIPFLARTNHQTTNQKNNKPNNFH